MKHSLDTAPRARGLMQFLRRLSWRPIDNPARATLRVIVICATMLVVAVWLVVKGPAVMSPGVPAFALAAEDGRATLHAAAAKAAPAISLKRERATLP